ncbi:MAG: hypothetical protein KBS81_11565, partial [Spirochaetales bacterium]|nr:hypothetical protein [Candidatus Physcosoma equi]
LSSLPNLASPETLMKKMNDLREGIAQGHVVLKKKAEPIVVETVAPQRVETPVSANNPSTPVPETSGTKEPTPKAAPQKEMESPIPPAAQKEEDCPPPEACDDFTPLAEPLPSAYVTEEADVYSIDPSLIPVLRDELKAMGKPIVGSYLGACINLKETEPGVVECTLNKSFSFNGLNAQSDVLQEALKRVSGKNYRIRLRMQENRTTERKASDKMEALKAIFGGGTINFLEVEEKKEAPVQPTQQEEKSDSELQSIRPNEADGELGSPDEDD